MVDNVKDYVIRMQIDDTGVVRQYEEMLKKMANIHRKYAETTGLGGKPGRPRGTPNFSSTQTAANINEGINRSVGGLGKIPLAGVDQGTLHAIDSLQKKLRNIQSNIASTKTKADVAKLKADYREATQAANRLIRAQQKLNTEISLGAQAGNKFFGSLKRVALQVASVYAAIEAGRVIFHIGKDMDSMRAALLAASDDAAHAEENFEFLKATSRDLGKDIQTMTGGFNRLGVAARNAGLSSDQTNEIFLAASEAATTFGLDTQRTGLVMLAFSQILSKGRVSMEEMSRQLGENLPIAMSAGAKSMGLTTAEFIKAVETGKVLSEDFMPGFAKQIRIMVRQNGALSAAQEKLTAQQQRLATAFKVMIDEVFQNGGSKGIGTLFKRLAQFIEFVTPAVQKLGTTLFEFVTIVTELSSSIVELATSITGLGREGLLFSRIWAGVESVFAGVASAVWAVIAGIQFLNEIVSGEWSVKDLTSGAKDWMSNALSNDPIMNSLGGSGTTITVDKIEMNGVNNSQDFVNEMTSQLAF